MTSERAYTSQQTQGSAAATTVANLFDRLSRFDGPPEQFLINLLAVQCHVAAAEGGAILRIQPTGRVEVLVVYPALEDQSTAPVWLAQSVEAVPEVVKTGQTTVKALHTPDDLYGAPAARYLLLIPMRSGRGVRGVATFVVEARSQALLAHSLERLELTIGLLSLYEMRLTLQQRQFDIKRLRTSMETLSAVNQQERFTGAAMLICNEVAARWQCERVSLGFLKGRYVHLKGLSHTEKFNRKMKLVQSLEAAMEECLDQDIEVVYPASEQATYVCRVTGDLSKHHGPSAIVSLPLRRGGEPVAVLTLERSADQPFNLDEMETLRLTGDLCTARIVNMYESDRWFGARAAAAARKGFATFVSPKHTWIKVAGIAAAVVLALLIFVPGTYKADCPFVTEATVRQAITAPMDAYIEAVKVKKGDDVKSGDELVLLSQKELQSQLAKAEADLANYQAEAAKARSDEKIAEATVYGAQVDKVQAEVNYLKIQIEQTRITSPVSGKVLTGDLEKQLGLKVKTGDVLFEVGPVEALRADLSVSEDQIADVITAFHDNKGHMTGTLATAAFPGRKVSFTVERINPVAEVVNQHNVFKVRVRLDQLEKYPWLRPGMEGLGKINIRPESYGWIWTRRMVNWVRMKLWI